MDQWFYEDIVGLGPAGPGFARVRIRPVPPTLLRRAGAELATVCGRISANWRRTDRGSS